MIFRRRGAPLPSLINLDPPLRRHPSGAHVTPGILFRTSHPFLVVSYISSVLNENPSCTPGAKYLQSFRRWLAPGQHVR